MAKSTYEYSFIENGAKTVEEAINYIEKTLGGFSKLKYEHMKAFIIEFKPEDKEEFKKNATHEKDKTTGEFKTDGVIKYRHGQAKSWFYSKYSLRRKDEKKSPIEDDFDRW